MSKFDEILSRKLTRKEFLMTLGMSFAWLFGISSIIGILSGKSHVSDIVKMNYGSGPYGGEQPNKLYSKK